MFASVESRQTAVIAGIRTVGFAVLMAFVCVVAHAAGPGSLDTSFGTGGIMTYDFAGECSSGGTSTDYAAAIALNADGVSPVLGGRSVTPGCYYASGLLVSPQGNPTLGFRFDYETASASTPNTFNAVLNYQDQTAIYAGEAYSASAGIDQAYVFDFANNAAARIQLPVSGTYSTINGIAADAAGGILVVGSYRTTAGTTRAFISKLNADLSANGSFGGFGNHGVVSYAQSLTALAEFDEFTAVAIDAQGRPVAVGRTGNFPCATCAANDDFVVVRYNPNGSLDTNFGTGGQDIIDLDAADHYQQYCSPLGGGCDNACDGSPLCYVLPQDDRATAVAIDSQQRIVVAGYSEQYLTADGTPPSHGGSVIWDGHDFAFVRLSVDGGLDESIVSSNNVPCMINDYGGSSGVTLTAPTVFWADASGAQNADASGVVIDRNDAIDLGGSVTVGTGLHDIGLARFVSVHEDGFGTYWVPDGGFNHSGRMQIHLEQNFGVAADTLAAALALDRQGRLLVAGFTNQNDENDGTGYDFLAARVFSDGLFRDGFDVPANPAP